MKDLANKIIKITGSKILIQEDSKRIRPMKSEVNRLSCNNKKILSNTSWKPNYDLNRGLEETIDWFKKNIKSYKSDIYHV